MNCNVQNTLHINTPLQESLVLGKACNRKTFVKMESLQPSGSFKLRGLGNFIQKHLNEGINHLVSASGGNAGMATAYAGYMLNIPVSVVIPENAPNLLIPQLEALRAKVLVKGAIWDEANEVALELSKEKTSLYVPPYDHKLVWDGHSTIMTEILDECSELPSVIICSVGGGGLLSGILQGMKVRDVRIPVVAMETEGADCFNKALKVGKPINIGSITSIAHTLGALKVTSRVFELLPDFEVLSYVVPDATAIHACLEFADDHRTLVEPSCGAALSAGYSGIVAKLFQEGKIKGTGPAVFVGCGGSAVSLDIFKQWKEMM